MIITATSPSQGSAPSSVGLFGIRYSRLGYYGPIFFFHIMFTLIFLGMDPSFIFAQDGSPPPFDPAETQHGFADFETMPSLSPNASSDSPSYYGASHQDPSLDNAPGGLFQHITLAEDVDEILEQRRVNQYVPVKPTQQFTMAHSAIYVVFRVYKHYSPYQIFAQLYPRHPRNGQKPPMMDEDIAYLATEDESGYLKLFSPEEGWQPGEYEIHIFVGFAANPVTRMGTLHFTILPS